MALAPIPTKLPESGTVTVACKLPHGLILRLHEMISVPEPVLGGGVRETKVARHTGQEVIIKGAAVPYGKAPQTEIHGGYALTFGVDAQFFSRWMQEFKDSDMVKNGLIFAFEKRDDAAAKAKEQEEVRTGLEPIDPEKPGRGIKKMDNKI